MPRSPPYLEIGEVRPDRVVPREAREKDGGVLLLAQDAVLVLEHEAHPRHASAAQIFVAACADASPFEMIGTYEAAVCCRHLWAFTDDRSLCQQQPKECRREESSYFILVLVLV